MPKKRKPQQPASTQTRRAQRDNVNGGWAGLSDRAVNILAFVLYAAVLLSIYWRVLDAPFVYDDELTVRRNASITRLWPLWGDAENSGPLHAAQDLPTAGRPVVNLSLALNYAWGELEPAGYRILNLAVHYL